MKAQWTLGGLGLVAVTGLLGLLAWGLLRPATGLGGVGVNAQGSVRSLTPYPASNIRLALFDAAATPWQLADQRGQRVVVNFWASWCTPCRTEAGLLAQAARDYGPQGITVVGVNLWDDPAAARAFMTEFGLDYPNGRDTAGTVGAEYGITGIPETFVVAADGRLTGRWIGPLTRAALDRLVGLAPAQ